MGKFLSKTSSHCYSTEDNFTDHCAHVVQLEAFISQYRERVCPKEFLVPKLKGTVLIKAKPTMTSLSGVGQGNLISLVLVEHIGCLSYTTGQWSESRKVLNVLPRWTPLLWG